MSAAPRPIRTPDQRLRVFLSSTLKELEPERRAARAAIERLRLAPVMFELGARPHPPRDLYRSYLEQSDIFVGLYFQSYGWVAPDERISGLEDEYVLSSALPSLIYIKGPAPDREDRLKGLLDRIRGDDRSSYKAFTTPEELGDLLAADLATLLADRFDAARTPAATPARAGTSSIPAPYTAIIGRERDREGVLDLLARADFRLVTLLGPGGIGKSRLAIDVAMAVAESGREVAFVPLEAVSAREQVVSAIARGLGVRDGGELPLEEAILAAIADRDLLLVIDNMEHVLDAADLVVRMLTVSIRLQVLATSRSPLRVRAEHTVEIGPLGVPGEDATAEQAEASPAVTLFVQRAVAVRPDFRLSAANAAAIGRICRALDGVPLAIELAAAHVRTLSPDDLVDRLDSALSLLVAGARDLPARQRTLRSTIEWSVDLLDAHSRAALAALSVFAGPFALSSAEAVLAGDAQRDPLGAIDALRDASLLQQIDRDGTMLFGMLSTVRAYATELLDPEGAAAARARWTAHFRELARSASAGLRAEEQDVWLTRLEAEAENVGAVMRSLLDAREVEAATDLAWSLYMYLWISGRLGLVRSWMSELLETSARESIPLSDRARAIALYYTGAVAFWQDPDFDAQPALRRSAELFDGAGARGGAALARVSLALALLSQPAGPDVAGAHQTLERALAGFRDAGDAWGQAMTLVTLGRLDLLTGALPLAGARFDESLALATSQHERLGIVIAQNHRGWARFLVGDVDGAEQDFAYGLDVSLAMGHDEGVAYGMEGILAVAAQRGKVTDAGLLQGAAETLRRRTGLGNAAAFSFAAGPVAAVRASGAAEEFDRAVLAGTALSVGEVLARVGA